MHNEEELVDSAVEAYRRLATAHIDRDSVAENGHDIAEVALRLGHILDAAQAFATGDFTSGDFFTDKKEAIDNAVLAMQGLQCTGVMGVCDDAGKRVSLRLSEEAKPLVEAMKLAEHDGVYERTLATALAEEIERVAKEKKLAEQFKIGSKPGRPIQS